jgi:hypothetical protein
LTTLLNIIKSQSVLKVVGAGPSVPTGVRDESKGSQADRLAGLFEQSLVRREAQSRKERWLLFWSLGVQFGNDACNEDSGRGDTQKDGIITSAGLACCARFEGRKQQSPTSIRGDHITNGRNYVLAAKQYSDAGTQVCIELQDKTGSGMYALPSTVRAQMHGDEASKHPREGVTRRLWAELLPAEQRVPWETEDGSVPKVKLTNKRLAVYSVAC